MRRTIFAIILVAVVAILLVLAQILFYPGRYQPPATEKLRLEDITAPAPVSPPFAEEYKKQAGTLVIDLVHDNDFIPWELNVLLSRVVSRGFAFEYLKEIATLDDEEPVETQEEKEVETPDERLERMKEKLRYADAFAIILPQEAFTPEEVGLVREFVKKGGKLLLIGDPTRPSEINSVSAEFGLIFETDYLYNLKEYDGNYRNVFITKFAQANGLTENLAKIALYSAGSIRSPDKGIAFTDKDTLSSVIETKGNLSPLALTERSRVLAISDLTFMREPFNAVWDNNQLVSNIADWLTESRRVFVLSDFPYFLEDRAYIAYADPSVIDIGVELKNFLTERGRSPDLGQYEDMLTISKDMVFIGFFKEAGEVEKYLERGEISVTVQTEAKKEEEPAEEDKQALGAEEEKAEEPTEEEVTITKVEIGNIGQVYREEGTSILYLDQRDDRNVLIILSDSEDMMRDTVRILKNGNFRNWLISDNLGIYYAVKTEVKAPKVEENRDSSQDFVQENGGEM